jgi:hypothetical protein
MLKSHVIPALAVAGLLAAGLLAIRWSTESPTGESAKSGAATLGPRNRAAREELLSIIERSQDDAYRQTYIVLVPERPTGLGDNYDLVLYGRFLGWFGWRIEVSVRGDSATAEMVTKEGIRRGDLPAGEVDRLVRQLLYAYMAEEKPRQADDELMGAGVGYQTHTAEEGIVVVSRDPEKPFNFMTEPRQLTATDIDLRHDSLRWFFETRLAKWVRQAANNRLTSIDQAEERAGRILSHLRRIDPTPIKDEFSDELLALDHSSRDDLASVEAMLFSHLAVEMRLMEALPELERLNLRDAVIMLKVSTAHDPTEVLKAMIESGDGPWFHWAVDFCVAPPHPPRVQLLVDSLPRLKSSYAVEVILEKLSDLNLTAEQQAAIAALLDKSGPLHTRVHCAEFLLARTGEDRFYNYLHQVALHAEIEKICDFYEPERKALHAAVSYSASTGNRRSDSAELVRIWLMRLSPDAHADESPLRMLVTALGRLGDRKDLPLLERYCSHPDSSFVVNVVEAIAFIEPELALQKARERIAEFVSDQGGEMSFRWDVWPYFGLLFWRHDSAALPHLERALRKLQDRKLQPRARQITGGELTWAMYQGAPPGTDWAAETRRLIDYLNAESADERLAAVLAYVQNHHVAARFLRDVAEELRQAGADAEKCRLLLQHADRLGAADGLWQVVQAAVLRWWFQRVS